MRSGEDICRTACGVHDVSHRRRAIEQKDVVAHVLQEQRRRVGTHEYHVANIENDLLVRRFGAAED